MCGFPEGFDPTGQPARQPARPPASPPSRRSQPLSLPVAASRPGEYRDIFPSYVATTSDVGVLGAIQPSPYDWQLCPHNGSLILAAASPEKSGRYLCHVTNGIGQELNQVVNFTVKAPPHIVSGGSSSASLEERENAATKFVSTSVGVRSTKLECEARGDRPITVTWTKVRNTFISYTLRPLCESQMKVLNSTIIHCDICKLSFKTCPLPHEYLCWDESTTRPFISRPSRVMPP